MKIAAAQIRPRKGDIAANVRQHRHFTELAAARACDIIIFPELSLTGYEPRLANKLACTFGDHRLNDFDTLSSEKNIFIAAGLPTRTSLGITISMIIFQPDRQRQVYSKQYIHRDEEAFFIPGKSSGILSIKGAKIAPAICYEISVPEHAQMAKTNRTEFYLASVAKSSTGVQSAHHRLSHIAADLAIPVMMSNSVGACDDFKSAGMSAVWNRRGRLIDTLDANSEGLLIYDTTLLLTEKVTL